MQKRENWGSQAGFILASIGSAIGLGNMWMFPWRLGKFGGAAFLIPYLIFAFGICWVGLMGEFALGRSQQRGPISAYEKIFGEKKLKGGKTLGFIPIIAACGIFIFIPIVTGWAIKYFTLVLTGEMLNIEPGPFFGSFGGSVSSILWTLVAFAICLCIILGGIKKGIERINKIMIPSLFIMLIFLVFFTLRLPGAGQGLKYLFVPDWSMLSQPVTWIMALGQAFSSASLGGCGMVVYGSYLRKQDDIPNSALNTITFDTLAALIAALIIMPAVFAFQVDPAAGPPLLFITIPSIIKIMPGGRLFGILLFIAIIFAAITSFVAITEVLVEALMDRLNMDRKKSTLLVCIVGFIITIPLALNMNIFETFVDIVSIYITPIAAVLSGIVFFWIYGGKKALDEINMGAKKALGAWLIPYAKYVFIGVSIIIVIIGIINKGM